MRAAIYARYSSDNQKDASIADQMRLCRLHAERNDWSIVEEYADHAISGASLIRPGIQALMADAGRRQFDVILTESLDRLSRDQEDIAGIYKRLRFVGVRIVTLSEGEINELHIGLKGTMGALYLKDLADKTRRGLRGRIEAGKSGGGLCYGYKAVRKTDEAGDPICGERIIDETQAEVVRRIFREYADGKSSRAIAWALNRDGVVGPFGNSWGPSTIHGNPKRGNGVLNNELYIGRLVWNRQRFVKDPETGKRVSRLNPEHEWVIQDVPELRIVDDALWKRVKERQRALAYTPKDKTNPNPMNSRRRPKHLLAGLAKCGCCGGGYTLISEHLLGCATARNKGTCNNRLNIRRDALEASVLSGLRTHLMQPVLFREFCAEFTAEINRLRMEERASQAAWEAELPRIDRELDRLVEAICKGVDALKVKDKIEQLEARKAELASKLANAHEPPPLLHPNMAEIWRQRIGGLHEVLADEAAKAEALALLRSLIERVTLVPERGQLAIELRGDLAAMLTFAANKRRSPGERADLGAQVSLVAGG
ncbi:MAG: recombinase family protein [Rhodospirillales bacterium]|nr:recombinase family protein [Rhodospirillales bacterium]